MDESFQNENYDSRHAVVFGLDDNAVMGFDPGMRAFYFTSGVEYRAGSILDGHDVEGMPVLNVFASRAERLALAVVEAWRALPKRQQKRFESSGPRAPRPEAFRLDDSAVAELDNDRLAYLAYEEKRSRR